MVRRRIPSSSARIYSTEYYNPTDNRLVGDRSVKRTDAPIRVMRVEAKWTTFQCVLTHLFLLLLVDLPWLASSIAMDYYVFCATSRLWLQVLLCARYALIVTPNLIPTEITAIIPNRLKLGYAALAIFTFWCKTFGIAWYPTTPLLLLNLAVMHWCAGLPHEFAVEYCPHLVSSLYREALSSHANDATLHTTMCMRVQRYSTLPIPDLNSCLGTSGSVLVAEELVHHYGPRGGFTSSQPSLLTFQEIQLT